MLKKYLPVGNDSGVAVVSLLPGTGVVRVGAAADAVGLYVEELAVGVYVDDGCLAVVLVELAAGSNPSRIASFFCCVQNRTMNIDRAYEKINF